MNRRISVAHLTAIGLTPPELIETAARAGFDAVGLRLLRVTEDSPGYPLMRDPAMMAETRAALAATGLAVSDIEFVRIAPDLDLASLDPFLDAGAELGARHVVAAPYDEDLNRLVDRLSRLSENAAGRGLGVVLEFFPWTVAPNLSTALDIVQRCDSEVGVLVDSLHFDRSESTLEELRAVPPGLLPFAHLCDALAHPPYSLDDLLATARAERLPPGDGQIDLTGLLAALPRDIPLAIEAPMTRLMEAAGPLEVLTRVRMATRRLIETAST